MLASPVTLAPTPDWRDDLRAARLPVSALLAAVGLNVASLPYGLDIAPDFAVMVPPHFRGLIERGNPYDPLLLQVLARADERLEDASLRTDPLDEAQFTPQRGIVRKYGNRALLLTTGACAIHCRYCFRRHTDYGAMALPAGDHDAAIAIAKEALKRKTGARALRSIVEELMLDIMFEVPSRTDVPALNITAAMVEQKKLKLAEILPFTAEPPATTEPTATATSIAPSSESAA